MLVAYGSETGNAQDVAEMLAGYMKHAVSPDSISLPMDCLTLEELAKEDFVLFVCSTTGVILCFTAFRWPVLRVRQHK
jgi:flavodoxin